MKRKASPVRQAELSDGKTATTRAGFGLGAPGALAICEYLARYEGGRLVRVELCANTDGAVAALFDRWREEGAR